MTPDKPKTSEANNPKVATKAPDELYHAMAAPFQDILDEIKGKQDKTDNSNPFPNGLPW